MSNPLAINRMADRLVERQSETDTPMLFHPRLARELQEAVAKLNAVRDMEVYRLVEANRHVRRIMQLWDLTETQVIDIHKAVKKKLKAENKSQC